MAEYRVYCQDGAGKVVAAEWIEADDDEQALEIARNLEYGVKCEVWQRDRLVAIVPEAK